MTKLNSSIKEVNIPEISLSFPKFSAITIDNIQKVFSMDTPDQQQTLEFFIKNKDHGLEHEYNVYQKAIQIAESYEQQTGIHIRAQLIYVMAILHDAMRSIKYDISDQQKARKEKRNDRNHERYGAILFEKIITHIETQGNKAKFLPQEREDIIDYLKNHDYFSDQLNGGRFQEPASIEGQIVRLADRISIPLRDEIQRYRDTGKRLGTPFFNTAMPLEQRETISFDKMGLYFKQGWVDEVLFFTALLMITEKDFADPILGEMYQQRAVSKNDAALFIDEIATMERVDDATRTQLHQLLSHLGDKFGFVRTVK